MPTVPFNRPYATGQEFECIREAIEVAHLSGNGPFTRRCTEWLESVAGSPRALLTPSCTSALEMAAILADLGPGDEVLMPSFTFVSSANAVVLRGAVPVFVDVRPDTLNLDERLLAGAMTARTRAIMPVHYAGFGCEMRAICALADEHGLTVIEDAAHGVMASYDGVALGGIGQLGCVSFHETKNLICGEGGALFVNDPHLVERAEILQEKGTDRTQFLRGSVDKYTWVDIGSSYLLGEVGAAFLWAQVQQARSITERRLAIWDRYHAAFEALEHDGVVRRPTMPAHAEHNAHMYYLLLPDRARRDAFIAGLAERGVQSVFHYVPLHSSQAGRRFGRAHGDLAVTDDISDRLVRLPLWVQMTPADLEVVVRAVSEVVLQAA
ncbi:MAG: dTDP-4-amino-4,6-dideoxygalactose transaminase [Solirubrobacteraceae bacterium]